MHRFLIEHTNTDRSLISSSGCFIPVDSLLNLVEHTVTARRALLLHICTNKHTHTHTHTRVPPRGVTNTVLSTCSRSCLQADEISLNTGLSAMEGGRNWKQTLDLFACDFSVRLQRDVITFNSVINVCAARGTWSKAAQLLTDAVQTEMEINLITYNGAIRSCSQASRWQASLHCLESLRPINPDMVSFEAVINSCEACRELEMQGALLHRLEKTAILGASQTKSPEGT